jgi:hypothetical protein
MIMTAARAQVRVDGFSALGVLDAVVGVGPVGGHATAGKIAGAIPHRDPTPQRCPR